MSDTKPPREWLLTASRQIISDYAQACSNVDEGNLYFAATQFEGAYDELKAEVERLKEYEWMYKELCK